MMPPFICYLFHCNGMNPRMDYLAGAATEIVAFPRTHQNLIPILMKYPQDKPVALYHLIVGAHIFIGIGCIHYIPEPEDIVLIATVLPVIRRCNIPAVKLPEFFKMIICNRQLILRWKLFKGLAFKEPLNCPVLGDCL